MRRLFRAHLEQLARSERLAAEALRIWVRGPRPHADGRLERVCAQLDELSARWSALAIGGALALHWPETHARHAPGGEGWCPQRHTAAPAERPE
jgi:hypothetical protein